MNRAQMLSTLRRRLYEPASGDQWTPSELIEALNTGYQIVQATIMEADPQCAVSIDRTAIVSGQEWYPLPAGCYYPLEVAVLSGSDYVPIDILGFKDARARSSQIVFDVGSAMVRYSILGRRIRITPKPDTTISAGLQLTYVPSLTLPEDSSVPIFPLVLHLTIVQSAQLVLIGETAEGADAIAKEREILFAKALASYNPTGGENVPLSVANQKPVL